jgi:branched-chain amino acid transport system ATP-binding protein
MLEIKAISAGYRDALVLRDFSLRIEASQILCMLGRNGAGKTTALKAIMGLLPPREGSISFNGERLDLLPPHEIPRLGIGYVPQGRRLFAELTVLENLEIGLLTRGAEGASLDDVLARFPVLRERLHQMAGTLSGGEQQMLAMARALCLGPRLLLLDEPTEGLMPSMIAAIRAAVLELKAHGVSVLLVEQRVDAVLPVADQVAFVENGQVTAVTPAQALSADRRMIDRYVGLGA